MTPENLQTIRALADLVGLPDGLEFCPRLDYIDQPQFTIGTLHWRHFEHFLMPIWLAAFVAHAETEAEKRFGVVVMPHPNGWHTFKIRGPNGMMVFSHPYSPDNTTSRLMATAEVLLDGLRAVAGDGAKGVE